LTHVLIEQWNELPDDVTRKDGHGNVVVTPRPAQVAIPPTAKLGNTKRVLIAKMAMNTDLAAH
jgi:hypothetical protein